VTKYFKLFAVYLGAFLFLAGCATEVSPIVDNVSDKGGKPVQAEEFERPALMAAAVTKSFDLFERFADFECEATEDDQGGVCVAQSRTCLGGGYSNTRKKDANAEVSREKPFKFYRCYPSETTATLVDVKSYDTFKKRGKWHLLQTWDIAHGDQTDTYTVILLYKGIYGCNAGWVGYGSGFGGAENKALRLLRKGPKDKNRPDACF
jgi:hypothetical protein